MKYLLALFLALLPIVASATVAEERVHDATLSLYGEYDQINIMSFFSTGKVKKERWRTTCSGTAIKSADSNIMLTATHCYHDDFVGNAWKVDGVWRKIDKVWANGEDQMMVRFADKGIFKTTVPMVVNARVAQGQNVFWFGNPNGLTDILRRGYVASNIRPGTLLLDASGYYGDSGSGVFTADGRLVATVNRFNSLDFPLLMETDTIQFTGKQLQEAGVR